MSNEFHVNRHQDWMPESKSFKFSDKVFTNPSGGLSVGFRVGDHKLRVKTPKMRAPFGLQTGMNGKGYQMDISFDDSEVCQNFLDQCRVFDNIIEQAGLDNPSTWFTKSKNGKAQSAPVIKEKFHPMVRMPKKEGYHPTIRVKLPHTEMLVDDPDNPTADPEGKVTMDTFTCKLYDRNKKSLAIDDDSLKAGVTVSVLMVCNSIWSTTTGFGASWKAEQIMVFPDEASKLPEHCLLNVDSEDDEDTQHHPVVLGDDETDQVKTTDEADQAEATADQVSPTSQDKATGAMTSQTTTTSQTTSTPSQVKTPGQGSTPTEPQVEVAPPGVVDDQESDEPEPEPEPEQEPVPLKKPTVRARRPVVVKK